MFRTTFLFQGCRRIQTPRIHPKIRPSFSTPRRQITYVRFSTPGGEPNQPINPRDWRTWDLRVKVIVGTGVLGTAYYIAHQEQVPETGRWRFMNTSPEYEAKLAEAMYKQLRAELGPKTLPLNHPITKHVRRVASQILHASNLGILSGEQPLAALSPFGMSVDADGTSWNPDAQFGAAANPGPVYGPSKEWNVLVVSDQKMINAMAVPGTIVVFTGILPICQDEEGLAAVLSHEIGHVVARHTAERISSETIRLIFLGLLSYVIGVDAGITNIFHSLFLELPNSRTQEHEADLIGLRLMSRACYNPAAAPQVFTRIAKLESKIGSKMNFFSTHPSSDLRVKMLEEALPNAYNILSANPECEHVRQQIESFKASARAIKPDDHGEWGFA